MSLYSVFASAIFLTVSVCVTLTSASADQGQSSVVFGQSLMSSAEIKAHYERLERCKSAQEREQVEADHKDRMVQRARWKGMVLDGGVRTITMADNN